VVDLALFNTFSWFRSDILFGLVLRKSGHFLINGTGVDELGIFVGLKWEQMIIFVAMIIANSNIF
jgi:hypothetical protein